MTRVLVAAALALAMSRTAFAQQNPEVGGRGGPIFSTIADSGGLASGSWMAGAFVAVDRSRRVTAQFEANLASRRFLLPFGRTTYDLHSWVLQVPLLARFNLGASRPVAGYLVAGPELDFDRGAGRNGAFDARDRIPLLNLVAGGGLLAKGFVLDARYALGIGKNTLSPVSYTHALTISAGFRLR